MKVILTLLLIALVGSLAIEISHDDVTLLDLEPVSLGELMAQATVRDGPTLRELAFKLRNNILAHRELTSAAHEHYVKSSCGTPLARLEEHVARGVERRRNALRYAAVARRRCYQRNNSARELYPKIKKWKEFRSKAIKNLQRAAKRYFKEDGRLRKQLKELESGATTVQTIQTTIYGATATLIERDELVSLIESQMTATDALSQQVYSTVQSAMREEVPVDAMYRLVSGVSSRIKQHINSVKAARERARSSWISLKSSLQARIDSLNVRIARARARQASIASFSGRNCRLAARAAYKAAKASKALNPARIALENLKMLCTREEHAYNETMIDTKWELDQLANVAPRVGVPSSETGEWYASPQWSACVDGVQTRDVTCRNLAGTIIGVAGCSGQAPADKRPCTKKPSRRYRKWLLQHGREFGALSNKGHYRHSGYASDNDAESLPASHYKPQEQLAVSQKPAAVSSEITAAPRENATPRVSKGSIQQLRREAALRAAKRARARAARAARRARRNRRRIARRLRERQQKAKLEKQKKNRAPGPAAQAAQAALAAGANTTAPAPVAQTPPANGQVPTPTPTVPSAAY